MAKLPGIKKLNPITLFPNNAKAAKFWFGISIILFVITIVQPLYINMTNRNKQKVIIMDPTGTFYISPILSQNEAGQMFDVISTYAANAFLNRNPNGVDNPALLKQMYINPARGMISKIIGNDKKDFTKREIHQKAEISNIKVLEVSSQKAITIVTGQLVRVGKYNSQSYQEGYKFVLQLVMVPNPQLGNKNNMKLPYVIVQIKFAKKRIEDNTNKINYK